MTSNDSRIRLYDLRDLSLSMKYKGYVNSSSQIKASFRWEKQPWKTTCRNMSISDLTLLLKVEKYEWISRMSSCSCSHDYSFIVSGSEDKYVYIWSTYHDLSKFTSVRRDRNDFWEGIKGNMIEQKMIIYLSCTDISGSIFWQSIKHILLNCPSFHEVSSPKDFSKIL